VARHITITVNGTEYTADLVETKATEDLLAMLPMTLTLRRFGLNEQIAELPGKLDTSDSPAGTAAEVGDIDLYAPWGNFAMFYRAIPYSEGLVKLGHIRGDSSAWKRYGEGTHATFAAR
jgi:hypothetical protein